MSHRCTHRSGGALVVLLIALLLTTPFIGIRPAAACGLAFDRGLFPLGMAGTQLVLVQLMQWRERDPTSRSRELTWSSSVRLRTLRRDGTFVDAGVDLGTVQSGIRGYHRALLPRFRRAMTVARAFPDFKPLPPPVARFCGHARQCGDLRLVGGATGDPWIVRSRRGQHAGRRRITLVPGELSEWNQRFARESFALHRLPPRRRASLWKGYRLGAMRRYALPQGELVVVSLASGGWGPNLRPKAPVWPLQRCSTVEA